MNVDFRTLKVTPLTPVIGAEIEGVDLAAPMTAAVRAEIERALVRHHVIFFRDQALDHDQHVAFSRAFGPLYVHPALSSPKTHPEVQYIYYPEGHQPPPAEFHTDATFLQRPFLGCVLRAVSLPPGGGGDTLWASLIAAYDALSDEMKRFLDPLRAVHTPDRAFGRQGTLGAAKAAKSADNDLKVLGEAVHPLVRRHPVSGRKLIFVNRSFTQSIEGLSESESEAVLALLFQHIEQPEFAVRFSWREGSVAFWDNRATVHRVINDFAGQKRLLFRTTIEGDEPV